MERLNIDFKGLLLSATQNKHFLKIIDEYSRFPFVITCPNISSQTVINCLNQLFSLCGIPDYIYSDRGSSSSKSTYHRRVFLPAAQHLTTLQVMLNVNDTVELCLNVRFVLKTHFSRFTLGNGTSRRIVLY